MPKGPELGGPPHQLALAQAQLLTILSDLAELVQTLWGEVGQLRREVAALRAEAG
jgi:hypothetical protein